MTTIRWRRRPEVLWRRWLDAVVLLTPSADDVLTLAGTGPEVWELLAEWRTVADLVEILAAAHETSTDVVTADLVPLLTELEGQGVLQTAADSGGPAAG